MNYKLGDGRVVTGWEVRTSQNFKEALSFYLMAKKLENVGGTITHDILPKEALEVS